MGVGQNIKLLCKEKGLSLKRLSEISGVPYSTLKGISSRDPEQISPTTKRKIQAVLGSDLEGTAYVLTEKEFAVLKRYRKLTAEQKEVILDIVNKAMDLIDEKDE